MTDPLLAPHPRSFAARAGTKGLSIVAAIAIVVALFQRTAFTPFPHRADDFLAGFAVGATLVLVGAWIWERN